MQFAVWSTFFVAINLLKSSTGQFSIDEHDLKIKLYEEQTVTLHVSNITNEEAILEFNVDHDDIAEILPNVIQLNKREYALSITAKGAGHSEIWSNSSDASINTEEAYYRVTVYKNLGLDTFSITTGWIYFVAWSVSFYPQIYVNFRRKSVVGLNFDFLWLNIVGFTLYGIFNLCLYLIPEIQDEYFSRHPRGLIPVKINDIVFAVHAVFACLITIIQCFMYERGDQRVSNLAKIILGIFAVFLSISIILSFCDVIHWLDFLYYCSYVKLTITLIKYIPQAYMNYKRKSTIGWSIGNIFLDFTGGTLSMLQMILDAYNYDDWVSIFGDPTKFGLGLFSVIFDIFFIVQHYIFYRHTTTTTIPGTDMIDTLVET